MPIFEYKCKKCGLKFEKLVFGEEKIQCPKCKSTLLEKLFSPFNVERKSGPKTCQGGICDTCPTCKWY